MGKVSILNQYNRKKSVSPARFFLFVFLIICVFKSFPVFAQVGIGKTIGENGVFQRLKQENDGSINIGNFDGSAIVDARANVLSTITIKNKTIDFPKPSKQTRQLLLQHLYEKGVRNIFISLKDQLTLTSQGHIGLSAGNNGIFQAIKETENGYNFDNWNESEIVDTKGVVLASLVIKSGVPDLVFSPNNSLKTLYSAGLRFFIDKSGNKVRVEEAENGIYRIVSVTTENKSPNTTKIESPVKMITAKRTYKLSSPFGVYSAKNQQSDLMMIVKIKGINPEEFGKIKNETIYVMAGERRCELEFRLTFESGEHELAFAVPKSFLEFRLFTGRYPPISIKTGETIYFEVTSPMK